MASWRVLLGQCIMLLSVTQMAQSQTQTPVTTSGGSLGGLPVFTGSTTLGGSAITVPTFSNGLGGIYLRTPPASQQNTVVDPSLLYEGIASGDGSAAAPWGLNLSSVPWTWSQDQMTYHAGFHQFRTTSGNTGETVAMQIGPGSNVSVTAQLQVGGSIVLTSGQGGSIVFADGTVQSTAWAGLLCGGDYAESVDISGNRSLYEPGDVLVLAPDDSSHFVKSSEPYSTLVAGIYSTKPGLLGRRQTSDPKTTTTEVPMAMVGIVPTKVSAENGAIKRGDLLVTSSTLGYAMKGTDRSLLTGAIVGKALAPLDSGTGVIEVLVSLQ